MTHPDFDILQERVGMNCFVGLIFIAGIYLNPCLITFMQTPNTLLSDPNTCIVGVGSKSFVVYTPCSKIQEALKEKLK